MGSFDHLDEQDPAFAHIEELEAELVDLALRERRVNPGTPVACVVIEYGAIPFGPTLSGRRRGIGSGELVGVVEFAPQDAIRSLLMELAGERAVASFEEIVDAGPGLLPVASVLKRGWRVTSFALPEHGD